MFPKDVKPMANALTRKFSGKGYTELASACGQIKKWCEEASLGHSVEELKFSISATVSSPAEGQGRLFGPDGKVDKALTEVVTPGKGIDKVKITTDIVAADRDIGITGDIKPKKRSHHKKKTETSAEAT